MQSEFISVDHSGWSAALDRLPHDVYHRADYVALEAQRQESVPEAFVARDGDQIFFVPYLIRPCHRLFPELASDTFDVISPYGYPGMLSTEEGEAGEFTHAAIAAFVDGLAGRGVVSAFFRMHPILSRNQEYQFASGACSEFSETVAIDLALEERQIWKQIREGHRATIRKCQGAGLACRFVSLKDVFDEFLDVYEQTMNRVHAKDSYYFGRDYFAELAKNPHVHCCVVESGTTIVAACLFTETQGIVQAHLGGTRTEFLSSSPFHMTLYQAALWGKQRGNRWLHIGGGLGGSDDKLFKFKAGFSPLRFQFQTIRMIIDSAKYQQLITLRAKSINMLPETLMASTYFPAYRLAQ